MLKKYSAIQHVDLGLTDHFATTTLMCQAKRSKICFTCGCSNTSFLGSCHHNELCGDIYLSFLFFFFNFILCAKWASLASVDVMYMVTVTTHISMHVIIMWIAEVISNVAIEFGIGVRCQVMLASSPQGNLCRMHGVFKGGQGGNYIPSRVFSGTTKNVGIVGEARTLCSQGSKGGRHEE